jgi:uncharacterized protein YeaO (DUF488 family)
MEYTRYCNEEKPKIQTSYFANIHKLKAQGINTISISRKAPEWYTGAQYKALAPNYWLLKQYKDKTIDTENYTNYFYTDVLDKLDPAIVWHDLTQLGNGENIAILCYERPGEFCHRRIVAEWLESTLGVLVPEFTTKKNEK